MSERCVCGWVPSSLTASSLYLVRGKAPRVEEDRVRHSVVVPDNGMWGNISFGCVMLV
jgi:hypothetical protein